MVRDVTRAAMAASSVASISCCRAQEAHHADTLLRSRTTTNRSISTVISVLFLIMQLSVFRNRFGLIWVPPPFLNSGTVDFHPRGGTSLLTAMDDICTHGGA